MEEEKEDSAPSPVPEEKPKIQVSLLFPHVGMVVTLNDTMSSSGLDGVFIASLPCPSSRTSFPSSCWTSTCP